MCGRECRLERRRKQERQRRQADLHGYREDEKARQRACRGRRRAGASAATGHGPASSGNCLKQQLQIDEIVAEAFRRSRTGLERELRRVAREIRPIIAAQTAGGGP